MARDWRVLSGCLKLAGSVADIHRHQHHGLFGGSDVRAQDAGSRDCCFRLKGRRNNKPVCSIYRVSCVLAVC